VRGVKLLGKLGINFDLCMRPGEIADAQKLTEQCPDTRFVVDHCGNADVNVFGEARDKTSHDPDQWKRDIEAIARRPNVFIKISGIIAKAKPGWNDATLAPVINHCLDSFGPDRAVFGGDWPVCLLGASLNDWISSLTRIIEKRSEADRKKLWSENAKTVYRLPADLKL
jgi:L-fuconolactonase